MIFLRRFFSSISESFGFPSGWGIATAGTILGAPTVFEIFVIVQMWAVTIPFFSNSFAIVAPQRVHVPQVDVRITAETWASLSSAAISWANFPALATEVPLPTVA